LNQGPLRYSRILLFNAKIPLLFAGAGIIRRERFFDSQKGGKVVYGFSEVLGLSLPVVLTALIHGLRESKYKKQFRKGGDVFIIGKKGQNSNPIQLFPELEIASQFHFGPAPKQIK